MRGRSASPSWADGSDVHKATASRLVATLAERGLLERDPATERYRLGFGLIRLAGAAMAGLDIVRVARSGAGGARGADARDREPRGPGG